MPSDSDEKLLQEIRETYDYFVKSWASIRDEGAKDVKLQNDPWSEDERTTREIKGEERPCLVFDVTSQYTNQIKNEVLLNKRAIKIDPDSSGADMEHARFRQARVRQIEYKSNAQAAYATAFEGAVTRSYGYAGVTTRYCDEDSCDQEILIRRFPNPEAVLLDPDAKEVDCSDGLAAFVLDYVPRTRFKQREPGAKIRDFTADHALAAPAWITPKHILVAEYWKVILTPRTLFVIDNPESPKVFKDELPKGCKVVDLPEPIELENGKLVMSALVHPDGSQVLILDQRKTETRRVVEYITNGVEILDTIPWRGNWIPIVPCFGREEYVDEGSGTKRKLLSAVRKVRDPVRAYCYARSAQLEEIGSLPKEIFRGYEGQFATATDWKTLNKTRRAYVEFKAKTQATGEQILPLPQRDQHEPAIQALEMFCEATLRAVQAGMGQTPLPTAAQRQNQKSGIALERIENQMAKGSYHFVNNYDFFMAHMGRIVNDLLDKIEDTPRDVGIRKPDDTHEIIRLHEPVMDKQSGEEKTQTYGEGNYGVTVSTGPSYESEREEAVDFADTLAKDPNLIAMALQGQGAAPKILAKVIKLRNLGPIGDEMAEYISPSPTDGQPEMPPQAIQQLQQAAQQLQQFQAQIQELQANLQKLEFEKQAKSLDNQRKMEELQFEATKKEEIVEFQEEKKLELARLEQETKIRLAEITATCAEAKLRLEMEQEQWKLSRETAAAADTQIAEQEQEREIQAREQEQELAMAAQASQERAIPQQGQVPGTE